LGIGVISGLPTGIEFGTYAQESKPSIRVQQISGNATMIFQYATRYLINTGTASANGRTLSLGGSMEADAYYYNSDRSLKKNIKPIENALDKVLQLNGVSFDWKKSGEPSLGLIAQDVEKVFPELVAPNTPKSVQYANLVAPLIEAIKEQQKEINNLEARIMILEAKNK